MMNKNIVLSLVMAFMLLFVISNVSAAPNITYYTPPTTVSGTVDTLSSSIYQQVNVNDAAGINWTRIQIFNSTRGLVSTVEYNYSKLPYINISNVKLYIYIEDISPEIGYGHNVLVGAGAQSHTDGAANTLAVVTESSDSGTVKTCSDLVYGGYSDWYLPASDQLEAMYAQKDNVTLQDYAAQFVNFSAARYASSTEFNNVGTPNYYAVLFNSGVTTNILKTDISTG